MATDGKGRRLRAARAAAAAAILIALAGSLLGDVAFAEGPDAAVQQDAMSPTTTTTTAPPPTTLAEPPADLGPEEEPDAPVIEPATTTTTVPDEPSSLATLLPPRPRTTAETAAGVGPPERPSVTTITGPGSVDVGIDIHLDITVTRLTLPGHPAGDVDLYRSDLGADPALVATLSLSRSGRRGRASYDEVDALAVGDHTYTAEYSLRETDAHPFTVVVTSEHAPPVSLASSTSLSAPDPVAFAEAFDVSLTVSNASGYLHPAPTGTVDVFRQGPDDAAPVLVDTVALTTSGDSGVATSPQSGDLSVGTYTFTASYAGEASDGEEAFFEPSDATPVEVEVVPAAASIALHTSADSILTTGSVTLTAEVARDEAGSGPVPTGSVSFTQDGAPIGTATLVGGRAELEVATPPSGDRVYAATYLGEPSTYAASGQARHTVTVSVPPRPNIELHASVGPPGPSGSVVTVTAEVTGGDPTGASPSGDVQFTVTSTKAHRSRLADTRDQLTVPLGAAFVRTLTAGDYTVVAAYLGSAAFSPSTSAPLAVHVAEQPVAPVDPTEPDPPVVVAPVVPPPSSGDATPTTAPPTAPADDDGPPPPRKRHDPATPPEESPVEADEPSTGEAAQGAPTVVVSSGVHTVRSPLLRGVPDPDDLSWSPRHIGTNIMLALLLIILIGLPAELVNSTLKQNYERINKPFVGIRQALDALEGHLRQLPNPLLMVIFAMFGALIASELDPSFGINSTSITLFVALVLAFMVITAVLELARIPYLHRRHGERRRHHLRLFPLALVMGTVFVVISRLTEFRPGYIFGITCGLVLAEEIGEEDNARSLAVAGGLLLVTAITAWCLWLPWSSAVQEANPSLMVVFMDAFLATLWISALQVVIFGYAPIEALYGKIVQRWHFGVWAALYGTAMLLLVQFLLHPSANRWGGISSTSFLSMLTLFLVFLVGSVVFWAWYRFRPAPQRPRPPEAESDLVSVG